MKLDDIINRLSLTIPKARAVLSLLRGRLSPDKFKSVVEWARQCHREPRRHAKLGYALNELLGGYGMEAIKDQNCRHWRPYWGNIVAEYVNMGESYAPTLLFDVKRNLWLLTSYGDWVEAHPEL